MSHRNRRRDENWAPLVLMGLAALTTLFRRAERRGRGSIFGVRRNQPPSFGPVMTVIMLVGAFVALNVLLAVLSLISALGSGGGLVIFCAMPVAFVSFMAWMFNQRTKQTPNTTADSQPGTIDAMPGEVRESGRQAAAPQRTETWPAAPRLPSLKGRVEPETRRTPMDGAVPDKRPRTPAQYRQHAVSYRRKIQSLVKARRPGPIAERMNGVLQKLKSWEERVGQLADRLTLYENDELIQRDVRETPGHIARLQRQLSLEAEPEMQQQIRRTLAAYEEQLRQLELLGRVMKRTRLNLDDTLAAMGTVYSQLQVLNAMDIDGPTATRIAEDIDREVERLNDLLAAMSDVYAQSSETAARPAQDVDDESTGLAGRKARLGEDGASRG